MKRFEKHLRVRWIAVVICALLDSSVHQAIAQNNGPRSNGLGGVSSVLADGWSVLNNPAGLGEYQAAAIGFGGHNRFMISELTTASIWLTQPLSTGCAGLSYQRYGLANYQQHRVGLAYGLPLSERLSIGTQVNYEYLTLGINYPTQHSVYGSIGLLFLPSEDWKLGLLLINPTRARRPNKLNELIPMVLELGVARRFSSSVQAFAELEKDIDHPLVLGFGLEYLITPQFNIRSGVRTEDTSWRLGLAYHSDHVDVALTQNWSQVMGFSSDLALSFCWNQEKPRER